MEAILVKVIQLESMRQIISQKAFYLGLMDIIYKLDHLFIWISA